MFKINNKPVGDLKDKKEQKARTELKYEWVAQYNDNTVLKQYDDENKRVHHFGHIDSNKIQSFALISKSPQKSIILVDLLTGLFYINGDSLTEIAGKSLEINTNGKEIKSSWGDKVKLIYLRTVERTFNTGIGKMAINIVQKLGWEAEIDGKHEKHVIAIDEDGNLSLPPLTEA